MFSHRVPRWTLVVVVAVTASLNVAAGEDEPSLGAPGRPLGPTEIDEFVTHIFPDGRGLPTGAGDTDTGAKIYAARCASCHGSRGEGASALELVGDNDSLASEYPDRGVAAYWPYATSLFEYTRRAMPPDAPFSLDVDETYAVVAYLLALNDLVEAGTVLDAARLSRIRLPNREGFIDHYPNP